MYYFIKRLWINAILLTCEVFIVIMQLAISYELSEDKSFPWYDLICNRWFCFLLLIMIIYNIVAKMVIDKEKSADNDVIKNNQIKNYKKLLDNYTDALMRSDNLKLIRKELKKMERGIKK